MNRLKQESTPRSVSRTRHAQRALSLTSAKSKDILDLANRTGLLKGARTKVVRGRMPEALVIKAKERAGVQSDTELLELALASLAVADDFPEWLLSRKGTIRQDIDLEF